MGAVRATLVAIFSLALFAAAVVPASAEAASCSDIGRANGLSFSCDTPIRNGANDRHGYSSFYVKFPGSYPHPARSGHGGGPLVTAGDVYPESTGGIDCNTKSFPEGKILLCLGYGSIPAGTPITTEFDKIQATRGGSKLVGCQRGELHVTFEYVVGPPPGQYQFVPGGPFAVRACSDTPATRSRPEPKAKRRCSKPRHGRRSARCRKAKR